jgi:hypothetical protein
MRQAERERPVFYGRTAQASRGGDHEVPEAARNILLDIENNLGAFSNRNVTEKESRVATSILDGSADINSLWREYAHYEQQGLVQGGPTQTRPASAEKRLIARALRLIVGARGDVGPQFSRSAHLGTLTSDQEAALRNIHGDPVTWKQRLAEFRADWKKNLVQGLFDSYAPILDYSQKGYRLARQAKAGDSTLEALLVYGKVYVDKDGAYKVDYTKKGGLGGFAKVIAALHGEQDRFLEWVAAHRAERLKSIGLENLYSDQDIKALKTLNQGNMKDGKPRGIAYAKALADLNAWNDSVLKIAVDSGLIDEETRQMYKDLPYVPFYRLQEEGTSPASA